MDDGWSVGRLRIMNEVVDHLDENGLENARELESLATECGEMRGFRRDVRFVSKQIKRRCDDLVTLLRGEDGPLKLLDTSFRFRRELGDLTGERVQDPELGTCWIGRKRASGSGGDVYELDARGHGRYAIKVLASQSRMLKVREAEIAIEASRCPYLLTCYGAVRLESGHLALRMELVERSEGIVEYVRRARMSVTETVTLFAKVCEGVESLHEMGVVHADLKPSNILVGDDGDPLVTDFGSCIRKGQSDADPVMGTPGYMLPDAAAFRREKPEQIDVYALGTILAELLDACAVQDVSESFTRLRAYRVVRRARSRREHRRYKSVQALRTSLPTSSASYGLRVLATAVSFALPAVIALGAISHDGARKHATGMSEPSVLALAEEVEAMLPIQ